MIPYSKEEARNRLMIWGTVFTLTRWKDGKVEVFILNNEEVQLTIEELQDEAVRSS